MKTFVKRGRSYILAAATDKGKVKEENEDYFGIFQPETEKLITQRGILVVLADGMGGLFRGGRASRAMVDTMGEVYFSNKERDEIETLKAAFKAGNRRVFEQVGDGIEIKAGTTCTSAVLMEDSINIAHVGDSRAYLIDKDRIRQLTEDHSYVSAVGNSVGSRYKGSNSSRRRVMTRSVGVKKEVEIDLLKGISCGSGDTLLLCSDGLFSEITEGEIASVVRSNKPQKACPKLIKLALKAGGNDNITIVIAEKL
ncbi:MAG: protein phosphatase 2C domain-containing protein [Candidatus Krumholzibacteriota bacterium]|nr:protein phosphatase 2C domain-containing protein [Candidatus Krumholzibacteriota bacterium]